MLDTSFVLRGQIFCIGFLVQSQQSFGHLDEAQVSFRLLRRLCELLRSQTVRLESLLQILLFRRQLLGELGLLPTELHKPAFQLRHELQNQLSARSTSTGAFQKQARADAQNVGQNPEAAFISGVGDASATVLLSDKEVCEVDPLWKSPKKWKNLRLKGDLKQMVLRSSLFLESSGEFFAAEPLELLAFKKSYPQMLLDQEVCVVDPKLSGQILAGDHDRPELLQAASF
ncbi:hypothetical protein AK812_SmicGene41464 [Symbiodinium microadriaticum]|uniref:Uncharacterized protein n=1 Tax=Symbiodinium microadriaticum TaxID=2951 RepID=A0A1Q9C620_SYMMI|nr:hypothetical protein AK812_SmicGene41464 [Symbiodinium microadriaticum]